MAQRGKQRTARMTAFSTYTTQRKAQHGSSQASKNDRRFNLRGTICAAIEASQRESRAFCGRVGVIRSEKRLRCNGEVNLQLGSRLARATLECIAAFGGKPGAEDNAHTDARKLNFPKREKQGFPKTGITDTLLLSRRTIQSTTNPNRRLST